MAVLDLDTDEGERLSPEQSHAFKLRVTLRQLTASLVITSDFNSFGEACSMDPTRLLIALNQHAPTHLVHDRALCWVCALA